uniref:Uncharacterized protein n=1 Tax=Salix viminalis TaxID=40686 RepID=A0A6N2LKH9_SALVM
MWNLCTGHGSSLSFYWKLCRCNKSPTLHCIPCISSCQHNVCYNHVCICWFAYMASITAQIPRPFTCW